MRKQVSIRLNEELYKEIRLMLLKESQSFQKYIELLISEDLKKRGAINEQKENS